MTGTVTSEMAARTALLGLIMEIEKDSVDITKLKKLAALARPLVDEEKLLAQWRAGQDQKTA